MQVVKLLREAYDRVKGLLKKVCYSALVYIYNLINTSMHILDKNMQYFALYSVQLSLNHGYYQSLRNKFAVTSSCNVSH